MKEYIKPEMQIIALRQEERLSNGNTCRTVIYEGEEYTDGVSQS